MESPAAVVSQRPADMRPYAARDRASGSVASPNAARPTPVSSFATPVLAHGGLVVSPIGRQRLQDRASEQSASLLSFGSPQTEEIKSVQP